MTETYQNAIQNLISFRSRLRSWGGPNWRPNLPENQIFNTHTYAKLYLFPKHEYIRFKSISKREWRLHKIPHNFNTLLEFFQYTPSMKRRVIKLYNSLKYNTREFNIYTTHNKQKTGEVVLCHHAPLWSSFLHDSSIFRVSTT